MVNEPGSVTSLYVASPRDVVPFPTGAPSRRRAATENNQQASAGQIDRPGFSASIARIRASAEQRAEAAMQLRQFQTVVHRADELLAQIKEQLVQIVKQYPPFPHDDPQRIAYLKAMTGLRKQLDALTFPPERQLREVLSIGGAEQAAVSPILAATIKDDLAIPKLDPGSASDTDVETALDAIKIAQGRIQKLQGSMREDVVSIVGASNLGQRAVDQAKAHAGEVRGYIASVTTRGIGLSLNTILSIGL